MNDGGSSAEVASTVDSRTAKKKKTPGQRAYEKFVREKLESPLENDVELKESARWNIATYHLRRSIQMHSPREELWVATTLSHDRRAIIHNVNCGKFQDPTGGSEIGRSTREINFAQHPIRILGRRYPLTKRAYKYIDIAIAVKRESHVDIALGDCHGKEISLTPDMWRDLLTLRNDILQYFESDSDDAVARPPTSIIVGTVTLRFGKINNLKTLRIEAAKNRIIAMSHSTVRALFTLELCVNRIVASLTNVLEAVDGKLSRFTDIAMETDRPGDIPEVIRRHENFNANDLIDCELHALLFGLYYKL